MTKKAWFIVVISILVVVAGTGCLRSASTPLKATATNIGALPFPVPATDNALKTVLTQTAIAKGLPQAAGTVVVILPTATPQGGGAPQATAVPPAAATQAPPAPTAAPVAKATFVPTPGLPSSYTLQKGEFPYCIARRFNLNPGELLSVNGLGLNSHPAIGTSLKLPTTGNHWNAGDRALVSHPANYTVKSGDTANSIACHYGDVDPNAIVAVNGLKSATGLTAGQTLSIP